MLNNLIIYKSMLNKAGWREREIIKNAKRYNITYEGGYKLLHIYTNTTGVLYEGVYNITTNTWIG